MMRCGNFLAIFVLSIGFLLAYDDRPACYRELSADFFPLEVTQQALALYRTQQPQWDRIWRELKRRSNEAPSLLREKANARRPSPFEKPFQIDAAEKLLHETMYDIFYRVVVEYGFYDPVAIGEMFDYIWLHDARIKRCFPKAKSP